MTATVSYASTVPAAPDPVLLALSLATLGPVPLSPRVPVLVFVEPAAPAMTRARAVAQYTRLVHHTARRWRGLLKYGFTLDDLVQTGFIGLLRAADTWRDDGRPFMVYARTCITRAIVDVGRNARGRRTPKVALHEAVDVDDAHAALAVDGGQEDAEERARFAALVAALPERTRAMVLEHAAGGTYDEIAERSGLSYVRVGQIVRGAVAGMAVRARRTTP